MNKQPNRIIFDQDGDIVAMTGEAMGDGIPERKVVTSMGYVDVPYGFDYSKHIIRGVNPQTKELILEVIPTPETEDQRKVRELEDMLLLQMDDQLGGIL